jgi:hypothetical protein
MQKEKKIINISENIMNIFQNNARMPINQHNLLKAFTGNEWNIYHEEVIDYLIQKMEWIKSEENFLRFSLTDKGTKHLDDRFGNRNEKISEIANKIMVLFEDKSRTTINIHNVQSIFIGIEWNVYHQEVIDHIINKMKWVKSDESFFRFSLTDEGNKYLDTL